MAYCLYVLEYLFENEPKDFKFYSQLMSTYENAQQLLNFVFFTLMTSVEAELSL